MPRARRSARRRASRARAPRPSSTSIVLDESHRCKNPTAARSKLAAKLVANAGFCLWLSATAGQNPLELSYLAPLLASVTGARAADLKDFEQWCLDQELGVTRGTFGKWEWRGDRADCEKVRALLFEPARTGQPPAGIRRRPEDIAGWPAINRILTPIELDAEARALYDAGVDRVPPRDGARAARARSEVGARRVAAAPPEELAHPRARHRRARARAARQRPPGRDLGRVHRDADRAARGVSRPGSARSRARRSTAASPPAAREAERLRFQRGEARVVLFTVEEGISLHQGEHNDVPRSEVIHDLRWSAIQMAQIEGRCHRDGRFAQVYWAYADGTVEEKIARVVAGRIQSMKEMIGDDVETLREIERLLRAT